MLLEKRGFAMLVSLTKDEPINRAGKFVLPGLKGGMADLNNIQLDGNLADDNPNPAGADGYPISTLTWILAY